MTAAALPGTAGSRQSPFAGADICREAGLALPQGAAAPSFEDNEWDFTHVIGLPVQMTLAKRRFDFTTIRDPRWRLVAKELIVAMLAPRHEAVAPLPRAYRTPAHLGTAKIRLDELTRWLNWLTRRGVRSLGEVDGDCCAAWLMHRRHAHDEAGPRSATAAPPPGAPPPRSSSTCSTTGSCSPPTGPRRPTALGRRQSLGHRRGLRSRAEQDPAGQQRHPAAAAGRRPLPDGHPRPAHDRAAGASQGRRPEDRPISTETMFLSSTLPAEEITQVLEGYEQRGEPLPLAAEHVIRDRLETGWSPDDPLARLSLGLLARQAGFTQFWSQGIPDMRSRIEETLSVVGAEKPFGRSSPAVDRADGEGAVPWTPPLDRLEAVALTGIIRTASIALLAAVSGMRSSELMELEVGCCRPPEQYGDGLVRYRLASRIVKGQPLGGTPDEWVVIEPTYQAAQLLERLHDDPQPGNPLLGRLAFDVRCTWFRNWVNGPSGQRLGLAPIPDDPVGKPASPAQNPGDRARLPARRRPRRETAPETYRRRDHGRLRIPAGRRSRRTARRGQQARSRTQPGTGHGRVPQLPAGHHARRTRRPRAHRVLRPRRRQARRQRPRHSKAQATDRDVLNLMTKRAQTLHLGTANYCWFTDPPAAVPDPASSGALDSEVRGVWGR